MKLLSLCSKLVKSPTGGIDTTQDEVVSQLLKKKKLKIKKKRQN